ncbi:hypothetical protein HPB51_016681 [Rhipicephalus microplus]|uniref:Tick transposon n=1 Tax=Rhipicephalus microplus TaxID=6941 RepID=A0A9J6DHR7_RHIMP|nr:hypothetical protein HPB51_016681 [Rhipicephalus microplus]
MFDGESSSPESWFTFYEYACNENCWCSDEDKVKNMRLFLSGIAKSWSGSALSYFYEKRRLLQLADSSLPETSVVPLIIYGLSPDFQKQIQMRGPKAVGELLQGMRDLYLQGQETQRQPMTPAARNTEATQAEERRPLASWRPTATPVHFLTAQGGSDHGEELDDVTKN